MKKIILIAFGVYAFTSCKKDTTSYGSISDIISPSSATSYYAVFTIEKIQFLSSTTAYNTSAYFLSTPQNSYDSAKAVTVDSVKINGIPLGYYYTNFFYYLDTSKIALAISYPPVTWHVVGNNGIPSFTYIDYDPVPAYTGYNLLPDTIDHTKALTLIINNVTNSSGSQIDISDGHGNAISRNLAQVSSTITLSSTLMAQLIGSSLGSISVVCTKNNVQNVYGKAMNFRSTYVLEKQVFIK